MNRSHAAITAACSTSVIGRPRVQRDVRPHALREQEALLEHDRDRAAQLRHVDLAQVHPADLDVSLVGVDEPHHQLGERALADAGRADDRDGLAGCDLERHPLEHRGLLLVLEPQVVHVHP